MAAPIGGIIQKGQVIKRRNERPPASHDPQAAAGVDSVVGKLSARTFQITNSWATPRTPISKSRFCAGGRAKCQVKPAGAGTAAHDLVGQERRDRKFAVRLRRIAPA